MAVFTKEGRLVDMDRGSVYPASITVEQGRISTIKKLKSSSGPYIVPGFIDAHIHVESSMLPPAEFGRLAVTHGTVAVVSDPHEIGNVLGVKGVEYMIANSKQVDLKFYFGAPSCVPATDFETAGAEIDGKGVDYLLAKPEIHYLAEMMNWPGVIARHPMVMEKIGIAQRYQKPVDGHAPGLTGIAVKKYVEAGISTDHECYTLEEALEKLNQGMHIIIREGSAARNFDTLIPLLPKYADKVMFCSDDLHPDKLIKGHINLLVKRAVSFGIDPLIALQAACVNPVNHYALNVGLLKQGDPADLLLVDDLENFEVLEVYIQGKQVARNGKTLIDRQTSTAPNKFFAHMKDPSSIQVKAKGNQIRVICAEDGQLVTGEEVMPARIEGNMVVSDPSRDILKIVVVNRYQDAIPAVAFVKNFGLKHGAIASSVAHDSHNIIAVGVDDESICSAINEIIGHGGGVVAVDHTRTEALSLPIAGLMSTEDGYVVSEKYQAIDAMAKSLGSQLEAPFMTLSFMALLVIPSLKLSDLGLFNGEAFQFVPLFQDDQP
jgi:adenine deaminase